MKVRKSNSCKLKLQPARRAAPFLFYFLVKGYCSVFQLHNQTENVQATSLMLPVIYSINFLRVRAFFHKTVRVCHLYCNFKVGFTCRITVTFGTLKDGSLLISTLASNICFSYRNKFQNGVDALSKIVDAFLSKSSKFHLVRIIR